MDREMEECCRACSCVYINSSLVCLISTGEPGKYIGQVYKCREKENEVKIVQI